MTMAKKKISNKLPPFVPMLWDMLNSKAYKDLPNSSKGLLPYFLGKVKLPIKSFEYYETTFSFSYAEALKIGCARRTFYNVIQALMRNGFIDPVKKGGLKSDKLTMSYFRLSKRWKDYGLATFKKMEWREFGQEQIRRSCGS